jgi:hypothetical protein
LCASIAVGGINFLVVGYVAANGWCLVMAAGCISEAHQIFRKNFKVNCSNSVSIKLTKSGMVINEK